MTLELAGDAAPGLAPAALMAAALGWIGGTYHWQGGGFGPTALITVVHLVPVGVAVLAIDHRPGSPLFLLTMASVATLIATTIYVTVLRVVPINQTVQAWRAATPPSDWERARDRWHRLHHCRTALVVLALVMQRIAVFAY